MRIDMLLNKLCLIKTRTIAKTACDKGLVLINQKPAKASNEIKVNDVISFTLSGYTTILKINRIPEGNVSKKDAPLFYEIIERTMLPE